MIISSWNVNSIRARILNVQEYLKKFNPDIVLTQEIKTQEETYPFDDIKKLKYESYVFGQKSYNGVAILSKKKLDKIEKDIFKDKNFAEHPDVPGNGGQELLDKVRLVIYKEWKNIDLKQQLYATGIGASEGLLELVTKKIGTTAFKYIIGKTKEVVKKHIALQNKK